MASFVTRYLEANGLGQPSEIAYLLKSTKSLVSSALQEMLSTGELLKIGAAGAIYYALPASLDLLDKRLIRSKLKILSPFDNLLIQRKRMKALFGFDYQLECYVPFSALANSLRIKRLPEIKNIVSLGNLNDIARPILAKSGDDNTLYFRVDGPYPSGSLGTIDSGHFHVDESNRIGLLICLLTLDGFGSLLAIFCKGE